MTNEHAFDLRLPLFLGSFSRVELRGYEEINRPFRFLARVSVALSDTHELRRAAFEQPVSLALSTVEGPRLIHGIVDSTEVLDPNVGGRVEVALRIVPRLDLLRHKKQSRIFQNQTTRKIAETIFAEARVASRFALTKELPERTYTCQYHETDLRFIHRIFAADGLFYWFEHTEAGPETVVVADDPTAYEPVRGRHSLVLAPHAADSGMVVEEYHATKLTARSSVRPKTALRRAFDMQRPRHLLREHAAEDLLSKMASLGGVASLDGIASLGDVPSRSDIANLSGIATAGDTARSAGSGARMLRHGLGHDDHLGSREQARLLESGAERYLDGLRADAVVAEGESVCRRLEAGHTVKLDGHPADLGADEWVLTRVEHHFRPPARGVEKGTYVNRFVCAPRTVPVRPAIRRAPRALRETATVVGPLDAEIHTDELGRVKVQFHWDLDGRHDDHASCWLRVQQAWAGPNMGTLFTPRVGNEVCVDFIGGDPDRPMVSGSLYDGVCPPPYKLPDERTRSGIVTRSTPDGVGGHELLFDDRKDGELIRMRSEGLLHLEAKREASIDAGGPMRLSTAAAREDSVGSGYRLSVGAQREVAVHGADIDRCAARASTIEGPRTLRIGGDDRVRAEGAVQYDALKGLRVTVGTGVPAHDTGDALVGVNGLAILQVTKELTLRSAEKIRLAVGDTELLITKESVEIRTKKLKVDGAVVDVARDKKTGFTLGDGFELKANKIKLAGSASSLVLDSDAKLDGSEVLLGSPDDVSARAPGEADEKGEVTFSLTPPPAQPTLYTLHIATPDGMIVEKKPDASGRVKMQGRPGEIFSLAHITCDGRHVPTVEVK